MKTTGQLLFAGGMVLMLAAFFMPVSVPGDASLLDGMRLANTDMMAQRAMAHLSGAAAMIAGAVFWAIGELAAAKSGKRPPDDIGAGQF